MPGRELLAVKGAWMRTNVIIVKGAKSVKLNGSWNITKELFGLLWNVIDVLHLLLLKGFQNHKQKATRKNNRELCARNVGLNMMNRKSMSCSVRVYNWTNLRKDLHRVNLRNKRG